MLIYIYSADTFLCKLSSFQSANRLLHCLNDRWVWKMNVTRSRILATVTAIALMTSTSQSAAALDSRPDSSASATHSTTQVSAQIAGTGSLTEISPDDVSESSLVSRVENAATFKEVSKILHSEGYRIDKKRSTVDTVMFTQTIDKVTVDYPIYTQAAKDRMESDSGLATAQVSGGWNWSKGGPYVKATPSEWLRLAKYGSGGAVGLCTLIGNVLGAAACGVVAGSVSAWINDQDIDPRMDRICIARSAIQTWIEDC